MPTNILRQRARGGTTPARVTSSTTRIASITVGLVAIRIRLAETLTAARIWSTLPLSSTVETWGACIHFEVPVHSGRERNARLNVVPGDICFWSEDNRILIGFGPTPISKPNEIRLMRPCNIWASAIDDVAALSGITPGERVVLQAMT
jgi:uncharacterized protein